MWLLAVMYSPARTKAAARVNTRDANLIALTIVSIIWCFSLFVLTVLVMCFTVPFLLTFYSVCNDRHHDQYLFAPA